ncbi:MAG: 2OG-Fe(II) oxygenase [Candidatus Aquirickettsiella gammari]
MSEELNALLAAECISLRAANALTLARVGGGKQTIQQTHIRNDQIAWLEVGQSVACDTYLRLMDQVRVLLNQTLYLGLEEYESHFSFYVPGASYGQHRDRFRNDDARTISVVIYLNDNWLTEQGGALRLHPQDCPTQDIAPMACRMVVFLSAEMLHEVLPATRDRMSLTGWFRRRSQS